MRLDCFKTLWGHPGTFAQACEQAAGAGFAGVEGPAPTSVRERQDWHRTLAAAGLTYIAEICTAGSYVPDRAATVREHLDSLERKLEQSMPLSPLLVTCLGGCDAWEEARSLEFFAAAMQLAQQYGADISFETHRGRSLFNPWVAARLCGQLPQLELTADFSHWCVVCERLLDVEQPVLEPLCDRVLHIHARVGYEQGPQVADPRLARYRAALESHRRWWRCIWERQRRRGFTRTTLTPEFGPDGYQQRDAATDTPVGDLWEINQWVAREQREQFNQWLATGKHYGAVP